MPKSIWHCQISPIGATNQPACSCGAKWGPFGATLRQGLVWSRSRPPGSQRDTGTASELAERMDTGRKSNRAKVS